MRIRDTSLTVWREQIVYHYDCFVFRRKRSEYYRYLAYMLDSQQGKETLVTIFARDARRYGQATVRGRLSLAWAKLYPVVGGDLALMWQDCFPASDLAVLRSAQAAGNHALIRCFEELAANLELLARARQILLSALWSAFIACLMLVAIVICMPLVTVPTLRKTFASLPTEYYSIATVRLFAFADFLSVVWPWLLACLLLSVFLLITVLPKVAGPIRKLLEPFWLWRFYRTVMALRFLASLLIALGRPDQQLMQLRGALWQQRHSVSPWLRWQLAQMLVRADSGVIDASTFDTGLLEKTDFWFFDDMVAAHGLVKGLQLLKDHLAARSLPQLTRRAAIFRWTLLLSCVATLLSLALWHYVVMDDLRRSLMVFLSA